MYTQDQLMLVHELLFDIESEIFSVANKKIFMILDISYSKRNANDLKREFYLRYDKADVQQFLRKKQALYRNRIRNSKPIKYSEASKEKMRASRRVFWDALKGTERESELKSISARLMSDIHKKRLNQTVESKRKRVESRKSNGTEWHSDQTRKKISEGQVGKTVSDITRKRQSDAAKGKPKLNRRGDLNTSKKLEVREKISASIRYLHRIGRYPFKLKSSGHAQIENFLANLNIEFISEYRVGRYSYDVYLPTLRKVIEFHGTYWHLDPRKYNHDFFDKSKNRYAVDQWKRDDTRKAHAISNNLSYNVIWQADWEAYTEDMRRQKILNIINNE